MTANLSEPLAEALAESPAEASHHGVELRARLRGVGLWSSAHADLQAWLDAGAPAELRAEPQAEAGTSPRPPASLLHSRLRRRTSTLTRAAVTALEAALAQSHGDIRHVRFVLVSSYGEIETTVALLEQLAEPGGPISPTKFHNSVHNTATGYMSIASGNHRESTALAGGPHNIEVGLLEALAGLAEDGGEVVLIFAEELLPAPFERADAETTFAVALHLGAEPEAGGVEGPGLNSKLSLAALAGPGRGPILPGVGGQGLSSMAGDLLQLLRAATAPAGPSELELILGHDPAVEVQWCLRLGPSTSG